MMPHFFIQKIYQVSLLLVVILFNFSCADELQKEINELKAINKELLLQIDINSSTIADLESQKAQLEAQKVEWQTDTALINVLIKKIDRILISKHVERYLNFIVGQEDFSKQSWQHLYDEDLFLIQSEYQVTNSSSFRWFYITGGETSMPVKSKFIHNYDEGLLASSESRNMIITWTITENRIVEINVSRKDIPDEYIMYLTDKVNGNIMQSTYYKGDQWTNNCLYNYNEQNLLKEIEETHYQDGNSKELFDYDQASNLIQYQLIIDEALHTSVTWDYNSDGEITKYYSESPWEIDSIGVSYLNEGKWEVYFMRLDKDSNSRNINIRRFDMNNHIIYDFSQIDDRYPSIFEYEYINDLLVKYISYYHKKSSSTNEWYIHQKKTIMSKWDENGIETERKIEDVYFSEDGSTTSGTLKAQKEIFWSENGRNMLVYSEEQYNLFPTSLFKKTDYVKVEHSDLNQIYDKKISDYFIENGVALYIEYSFEITEFYESSPFAPRIKVEKWFDANGEINSLNYYNDNNSTYNWNWVLQI